MTLPDPSTYPKPPGQQRPYPKPTKTGKASFNIPGHSLQGETAYEVYGDLECGKIPLIALHGGPGIPHSYLRTLSLLVVDYGVPVVMYDQIGCGESTHFPDRMGDTTLWKPELFMAELENLKQALSIKAFDLLGHSWGGMLASQYTTTVQPAGLRKLIICDSLASMKKWQNGTNRLLAAMPADVRETVARCEKEGKLDAPEYEAAMNEFNKRHACRLDPFPEEVIEAFQAWADDPTVCTTMYGQSDFEVRGSLKDWSVEQDLKKLTAEVVPGGILLINGYFDIAQDECMLPFYKEPSAKVKWVRFGLSAHCPQLEETEKYIQALGSFLED